MIKHNHIDSLPHANCASVMRFAYAFDVCQLVQHYDVDFNLESERVREIRAAIVDAKAAVAVAVNAAAVAAAVGKIKAKPNQIQSS